MIQGWCSYVISYITSRILHYVSNLLLLTSSIIVSTSFSDNLSNLCIGPSIVDFKILKIFTINVHPPKALRILKSSRILLLCSDTNVTQMRRQQGFYETTPYAGVFKNKDGDFIGGFDVPALCSKFPICWAHDHKFCYWKCSTMKIPLIWNKLRDSHLLSI